MSMRTNISPSGAELLAAGKLLSDLFSEFPPNLEISLKDESFNSSTTIDPESNDSHSFYPFCEPKFQQPFANLTRGHSNRSVIWIAKNQFQQLQHNGAFNQSTLSPASRANIWVSLGPWQQFYCAQLDPEPDNFLPSSQQHQLPVSLATKPPVKVIPPPRNAFPKPTIPMRVTSHNTDSVRHMRITCRTVILGHDQLRDLYSHQHQQHYFTIQHPHTTHTQPGKNPKMGLIQHKRITFHHTNHAIRPTPI